MTDNRQLKVKTVQGFDSLFHFYPDLLDAEKTPELAYKFFQDIEMDRDILASARCLNLGCGSGRQLYNVSLITKHVCAVDMGESIQVARRNCADRSNVSYVQADITCLPFNCLDFDIVYSIGVIHHLSDPKACFEQLVDMMKPGSWLVVSVYAHTENADQILTEASKRVTSKLPDNTRWLLAKCIYWLVTTFVNPVERVIERVRLGGAFRRLPVAYTLSVYASISRRLPKDYTISCLFDAISTPIAHHYKPEDLRSWCRVRNDLAVCKISGSKSVGWYLTVQKLPMYGAGLCVESVV